VIKVLIISALLCWFFIELQIREDPLQNRSSKANELEQLDTDGLDFSVNFNKSDLLFFQTLPKTELNPGFVFLVQSVLESLRRNERVHFLFYQNISYTRWRELLRHCFLRLYLKGDEPDAVAKFVFGIPFKRFNELESKFAVPDDLQAGVWHDLSVPKNIFESGLRIAQKQDFLYLTNDSEVSIPRATVNTSRKQVLLQYSSKLVHFLKKVYPSKRRRKSFSVELMGGTIEVTSRKVMMTSNLPSDITTPSWFSALEASQTTTLTGARNLRGRLFLEGFFQNQLIQEQIKDWAEKKDPKLHQILKNLKGSANFGFGTPSELQGDWFLRLDFKKRGHTVQAISYLQSIMERRGVGLIQQDPRKRSYSLSLPFLPSNFFLLRRGASLILSSMEDLKTSPAEVSTRKSFFAVDVNLKLYKNWLRDRWVQLARHYHVRTLKRCTKQRMGKKLLKVCPLGPEYEGLICPLHGPLDNPSINQALNDDQRFVIFEDFLKRFNQFLFTMSLRDKSLELEFEIN
tara:strand:- start:1659 stop:3203 length:1545 start_codon:yes stop_codon:yes gene_type:complete